MVAPEILTILSEFRKAVEKAGIRVSKIVLYGSQAERDIRKDSDIDVAVVSPDFGRDRFEEGVRLFELAYNVDPRIEPVPISLDLYETGNWLPLIYEIREKGISV